MIDKSVFLPIPVQQAFDLFTTQIGQWWPADRRHLNDPSSALFLLETGRFYERAANGTELDLGRVRLWQSPRRIVLDFFVGSHRPSESSAALWEKRAPIFERSWDAVLSAVRAATNREAI
jgi:hypothetical protein